MDTTCAMERTFFIRVGTGRAASSSSSRWGTQEQGRWFASRGDHRRGRWRRSDVDAEEPPLLCGRRRGRRMAGEAVGKMPPRGGGRTPTSEAPLPPGSRRTRQCWDPGSPFGILGSDDSSPITRERALGDKRFLDMRGRSRRLERRGCWRRGRGEQLPPDPGKQKPPDPGEAAADQSIGRDSPTSGGATPTRGGASSHGEPPPPVEELPSQGEPPPPVEELPSQGEPPPPVEEFPSQGEPPPPVEELLRTRARIRKGAFVGSPSNHRRRKHSSEECFFAPTRFRKCRAMFSFVAIMLLWSSSLVLAGTLSEEEKVVLVHRRGGGPLEPDPDEDEDAVPDVGHVVPSLPRTRPQPPFSTRRTSRSLSPQNFDSIRLVDSAKSPVDPRYPNIPYAPGIKQIMYAGNKYGFEIHTDGIQFPLSGARTVLVSGITPTFSPHIRNYGLPSSTHYLSMYSTYFFPCMPQHYLSRILTLFP